MYATHIKKKKKKKKNTHAPLGTDCTLFRLSLKLLAQCKFRRKVLQETNANHGHVFQWLCAPTEVESHAALISLDRRWEKCNTPIVHSQGWSNWIWNPMLPSEWVCSHNRTNMFLVDLDDWLNYGNKELCVNANAHTHTDLQGHQARAQTHTHGQAGR